MNRSGRKVYLEEGVKGGEDVGLVVVPTKGVMLGPVHFAPSVAAVV